MQKVSFIQAHFKRVGHEEKVEKNGTLVDRWVDTGHSDCLIDGERLANDLQELCDLAAENGHRVSSVIPVNSGQHEHNDKSYGYGFSLTSGLIVVVE